MGWSANLLRNAAVVVAGMVVATDCRAQSASLVVDVRTLPPVQVPSFNSSARPGALSSGSRLYFVAYDPVHGWELWRTDGTPAGTQLALDVYPGAGSGCDPTNSGAQSTAPLFRGPGDTIFFFATIEGANSLWVIRPDGSINQVYPASPDDPKLVVDGSTVPARAAILGNSVYFAAGAVINNVGAGQALWASDGTAAGTRIVFDPSGAVPNIFGEITTHGDRLYFACSGTSAIGNELWTSDGTPAGTALVKDINTGTGVSSYPHGFVEFQNDLYFFATPLGTSSSRLFRTDGTATGTAQISATVAGNTFNNEQPVATSEGLYFISAPNGMVYRYDGTNLAAISTTALVNAINTARVMAVMDDHLYYCNTNRLYRAEHGGSITTVNPAISMSVAGDLLPVPATGTSPARLYFTGGPVGTGNEPWVTDGTVSGTVALADITAGTFSGAPRWLGAIGDLALFAASDASTSGNGNEPYITNGTPAGTLLLRDIYAQTSDGSPSDMFVHGGSLYFDASTNQSGVERHRLDLPGTAVMCEETLPGSSAWNRDEPTSVGGTVFSRVSVSGTISIRAASTAEGVGTELLSIVGSTTYNGRLYSDGARCYFQFRSPGASLDDDTVPWVSDGTASGTLPLSDLALGAPSSVYAWTQYQGETYFLADYAGSSGISYSLYATSGTPATTRRVTAAGGGTPAASSLRFAVAGGRLFYNAFSTGAQTQLWVYDGDGSPIRRVKPNASSVGSQLYCSSPAAFNGRVFWGADIDQSQDAELWVTDGTEPGTLRVKDIVPGLRGSFPGNLTTGPSINGPRLYFSANDGVNGRELWVSDGTADGTTLLKDIFPGPGGSFPQSFIPAGNRMYFLASDGEHGLEWWSTDGTAQGTQMVADIYPGPASCNFAPSSSMRPLVFGDDLYVSALDPLHGNELWVIKAACRADFNGDQTTDFFDYLDFVAGFAAAELQADFNHDSVVDFFDYLDFVEAFSQGC